MVQTTSIELRGDRYAAKELSLAHTNRLLRVFREQAAFRELKIYSHRENFFDVTGLFIGSIVMSTVHGTEYVIVDVPPIPIVEEIEEAEQEKEEGVDIPNITLLMPLFEEDYYFAGHEDDAFGDFLEYGSLVLGTKFSDPYLWLPENPPIFWKDREVPEVYYLSDSIITEKRRAGESSSDVRDKYNDIYYTGGDPHFEVIGAAEIIGDESLPDCFMFLWYEESGFEPVSGVYVNLRYGVNINGEEVVLYEGDNSYFGASSQCTEIYDFSGTPVYVFSVGFKSGDLDTPGDSNLIYGDSLNGIVTTKQYAAEGSLNYKHQISQELHRTDGWAHGRLRAAEITKQLIFSK